MKYQHKGNARKSVSAKAKQVKTGEVLYKHSENSTKQTGGTTNERTTENQNQTEGL